jgi:hypothetical protein
MIPAFDLDVAIDESLNEVGIEPYYPPPVWKPQPGPQTMARDSKATIIGFGGQAGGGKSDLLLGLPTTEHKRAIIFRRIYKNLRPLVDRLAEILGTRDGLNESLYRWQLPDNQQIEFGAMQYEHKKEDYRGNPHDYYGFDEVTEFTESQVRFVIGWLRSTVPGQQLRVVMTFNPPENEEGQWVVDFFGPWLKEDHPNPAQSGEIRYFAMVDGKEVEVESGEPFMHNGEELVPMSRTFIRARLDDNEFLAHDGAYKSVLQSLPEPMRSQLLKGLFNLKTEDNIWQVIPTAWIKAAQERWLVTEKPDLVMRAAGVDVARGGKDATAIARLYGVWFDEMLKYPGIQTPDGDTAAEKVMRDVPREAHICIDVIGVGSSAYDSLKRQKMRVTPVNNAAAAKPTSKDKTGKYFFVNVRAESYWHLREALDPASGQNICLPPGREVLADLAAPRFKVVAGKLQIEAKEDIIARIGRSPDIGDAIVLCWKAASGPQFKSGWQ